MVYTDIYISLVNNTETKKTNYQLHLELDAYRLDRFVECSGNCVLYHLQGGPDKAFENEEY